MILKKNSNGERKKERKKAFNRKKVILQGKERKKERKRERKKERKRERKKERKDPVVQKEFD